MPRPTKSPSSGPVITEAGLHVRDVWMRCYDLFSRARDMSFRYRPCPQHDGGFDARTRKTYSKPVWNEMAARIESKGLRPVDVIPAFFYRWDGGVLPQPQDVVTDEYLKTCVKVIASFPRRLTNAQFVELRRLSVECDRLQVLDDVTDRDTAVSLLVVNQHCGLSPLHRFALAYQIKRRDLAANLAVEALSQYNENPQLYDQCWDQILRPGVVSALVSFSTRGVI